MGRGAEPSLAAHSDLAIGFGGCGREPFQCTMRPDQDLDVGFLKFFVLTKPTDLSGMEQMSPFQTVRSRDIRQRIPGDVDEWDVISIPVVQCRR